MVVSSQRVRTMTFRPITSSSHCKFVPYIYTDFHQYLLPTSSHPPHCSKTIPYSLALCIRCICSDDEAFEKRMKDLSEHLNKRGSQKQVIDQAIEKVRHMERQNLLSYKPKPTANKAVLPFVMTYHPELPKVRGIVDKHWSIIESSDHLSTVFPQKPIMAFRRPKSLRDHLVRARLKPIPSIMSLLENANPVADQDVKPAK